MSLDIFKELFILIFCECFASVWANLPSLCSSQGGQKRASGHLEVALTEGCEPFIMLVLETEPVSKKYSRLLSHLSSLKSRHLTIINSWFLDSYITIVHVGVAEVLSQGSCKQYLFLLASQWLKQDCTKAHSRKSITLLDFLIENR